MASISGPIADEHPWAHYGLLDTMHVFVASSCALAHCCLRLCLRAACVVRNGVSDLSAQHWFQLLSVTFKHHTERMKCPLWSCASCCRSSCNVRQTGMSRSCHFRSPGPVVSVRPLYVGCELVTRETHQGPHVDVLLRICSRYWEIQKAYIRRSSSPSN
jgi:hypothetical protein